MPERYHSPAEIDALLQQGVTQTEIARREGVTPQAISKRHLRYGSATTRRALSMKYWPWSVPNRDMNHVSPALRARDHLQYMATGNVGMSADKLKRLDSWYRGLLARGEVLEFDPELPPIAGVSKHGGWQYVSRSTADGELLIRINAHAALPEENLWIWQVPEILPGDAVGSEEA